MSFLPASRTKRNLFKIASLGLAGLLAGLLSGCTDAQDTTATASHIHPSSGTQSPETSAQTQPAPLPKSIEATQIPALRHPPSSRSLQYGSVRTVSMTAASAGRNGS